MARKIVNSEVFEINTSSMSKPRKILYNKIIKNYRFCEIYDFLKFIYINEVNFSDIFMRDLFYFLIKIERYTSEIIYRSQSNDLSKKYDINLINVEISLRYMINKILEAVIAKNILYLFLRLRNYYLQL